MRSGPETEGRGEQEHAVETVNSVVRARVVLTKDEPRVPHRAGGAEPKFVEVDDQIGCLAVHRGIDLARIEDPGRDRAPVLVPEAREVGLQVARGVAGCP